MASGPSTLEGFKEWCEQRSVPEDLSSIGDHDVVAPYFYANAPGSLYVYLTTKHLTGVNSVADCLMTDGTYKLNYHSFPGIVTGSLDANHHFHATGFHLSSKNECSEVYEEVSKNYVADILLK